MAIEQLYNLDVAAELIPFPSKQALYMFLNRNKEQFPPLYRTTRRVGGPIGGWEQRFLSESEILKIREMTLHGIEESRYGKGGPRGPKPNPMKFKSKHPLANIMKRAYA